MHPLFDRLAVLYRHQVAQGILYDAEMKSTGRATRIEKWSLRFALVALVIGFLLSSQTHTHTTGWIVFFSVVGMVIGVALTPYLPFVQTLQTRLSRSGLEAAFEMKLPDLLAAHWAINEMARTSNPSHNSQH